jgi:AraC family transcriptional regulator, positive regulator of tynA and feaB
LDPACSSSLEMLLEARKIAAREEGRSGEERKIMALGENAEVRPMARMSTVMEDDTRKFEYFCDAICGVYCGIQPEQPANRIFNAAFSASALTNAVAATITAPGHKAHRDRAMIRSRPDDNLFLNFSTFSGFAAEHAGQSWHVRAETPFLMDNNQSFHLDFDSSRPMRLHSLRFSKDGRSFAPEALRRINLAMTSTATGRQLGLQMRLMTQAIEADNLRLAGLMSDAVLGLLSLLVDGSNEATASTRRLDEIKSVARGSIGNANFCLEDLAKTFRCSARTLQNRFAERGENFSNWLLAERLDLARDRLVSNAFDGKSIEAIARSTGFRDISHFYRAFKQRFSMSPGETRR